MNANQSKPILNLVILVCYLLLAGVLCIFTGCSGKNNDSGISSAEPKATTSSDIETSKLPHPAFSERIEERAEMVLYQILARDIKDPNVLMAMRDVPRHAFIPASQQKSAYADNPLPIGEDQTISQPYIVAFMTEALQLKPDSRVLEIGTGSGYQAAVCAEIAKDVYTIEIIPELAESATKTLATLGYTNIHCFTGDGFYGLPDEAPFDAIIGTAAAADIPKPLLEQLKPGGRMIIPTGGSSSFDMQYLILVTKDKQGNITQEKVMPVRFVPMTGRIQNQ